MSKVMRSSDVTFSNRARRRDAAGPASGHSSTELTALPQLLDHSHHVGIRRKPELGLKQICMLLGAPQRRRPIADRHPRVRQAQHGVRVIGIQLRGAAPPLRRLVLCWSRRRELAKSVSASGLVPL